MKDQPRPATKTRQAGAQDTRGPAGAAAGTSCLGASWGRDLAWELGPPEAHRLEPEVRVGFSREVRWVRRPQR